MSKQKNSPFKANWSGDMKNLLGQFNAIDGGENLAAGAENFYEGMENPFEDIKNPYGNIQAKNVYANIENPYAGLDTNLENTFEDLTVNQKQANFQAEQSNQQRADMLSQAGGNLTPGMAQMMANQGANTTRQISADIGSQESANSQMKAKGAADVQQQKKALEMQKMKGAFDVDQLKAQGELQKTKTQMQIGKGAFDAASQSAQGEFQTQSLIRGGQMTQQGMIMQGASDARSLELSKIQGLMSLTAGAEQAARENKQNSRSWFNKVFASG
tara:strand:- start:44 stop:859 length:816 start_codon:yes stop_codon:yes gene_type:complete